jgi:site-specific DNA-methyltransferase (adenine-specific)
MNLNQIICGDALEVLKFFPNDFVDCVVTSPPYNKGGKDRTKDKNCTWNKQKIIYGDFNDNLPPPVYIQQQKDILNELVRIIKPTGSIFYNHKSNIKNHKVIFPEYIFGFNLRQIIIWDRGSTMQLEPIRWYPTTEYIFWITKNAKNPKFYRRGKFDKEVWRISPKPMKDHPAPYPEELVAQCLISTTDKNDIVLDPYIGIGTTALVAKKLSRNYLGIELNKNYIEIAQKRLAQQILNF